MRHFLTILSVLGVVGAGMSSGAMAAGNLVADLVPTSNAIACTADLAVPNCESDAVGGSAVSKLRGQNYLNTIVANLLASQVYAVANNATGLDCAGVVGALTTAANGTGSVIAAIGDPAGFVTVCREQDGILLPIMSGNLDKLGQPGGP